MGTVALSEVQVDTVRNLLRIRFRGHVTAVEMEAGRARVEALLPPLRPGFSLLTDLSALEAMDLDCVAPLTKIMDRLRAAGISEVVRVVPDPAKDIGFKILSIIHYRRGVRILTCESLAEAEHALPAPS